MTRINGHHQTVVSEEQYFELARRVLDSGVPNCDGVHIPIESKVNIEAWKKYSHIHGLALSRIYDLWFSLGGPGLSIEAQDG